MLKKQNNLTISIYTGDITLWRFLLGHESVALSIWVSNIRSPSHVMFIFRNLRISSVHYKSRSLLKTKPLSILRGYNLYENNLIACDINNSGSLDTCATRRKMADKNDMIYGRINRITSTLPICYAESGFVCPSSFH